MKYINYTFLLTFSQITHMSIEWSVGKKNYQIFAHCGGAFERFFMKKSHPTRRNVGKAEIASAISAATEFLVYGLGTEKKDADRVTPDQLNRKIKLLLNNEKYK